MTRRVALPHPVDLAPGPEGGWWVLCAVEGWSGGAHRLALRTAEGRPLLELSAPGPARLVSDGAGGVLVLPSRPGLRWLRLGPDGRELPAPEFPELSAAAGAGGVLLLGGRDGRLRSLGAGGQPQARALEGSVLELAAAPVGGGWWALVERGEPLLVRLGPELAQRWSTPLRAGSWLLAPLPASERAWLLDAEQGVLGLHGRGGAQLVRVDPALRGAVQALATSTGGLLVLTPGAVLAIDAAGRREPGQGGFDFLSAAIAVAHPPAPP